MHAEYSGLGVRRADARQLYLARDLVLGIGRGRDATSMRNAMRISDAGNADAITMAHSFFPCATLHAQKGL